ncbi:glycosyltransferase WbuB [Mycetocola zhujimingii]|uniref:D-inositol 3-phosphate glycosyltransferase n=1 Tax=Mycetocola zhujimingii TaxID=2079792 RepID=A0A2U1TFT9_9MICO|nr:glycosyltransferase WbuB [Mycetocola zhujimingii]
MPDGAPRKLLDVSRLTAGSPISTLPMASDRPMTGFFRRTLSTVVDNSHSPRVTIVGLNYSPEPTGIAPYTTGLAEGLVAQGHDVRAISSFPHYPQWQVAAGYRGSALEEVVNGVSLLRVRHYVPRTPTSGKRLLMEMHFGLRALFAPWKSPDVVVLVSPALFATRLLLLRARISRIPACVWVQDIYSLGVAETGSGDRAARLVGLVERSALKQASRTVVIHDRFKRYLTSEALLPADSIDVVRNWSHIDDSAVQRDEAMRRRLGWGPEDIIVLHAGNMGAKQGLHNVVRASHLAEELDSRVRFVLLGDGNARQQLESGPQSTHLQFLDPLPDGQFEVAIASADILLVNERPGLTEMSVPSKLTSYFATGLPVIGAVDEGSITAEELRAGHAGPIVDPNRPIDLLHAAEALADDPERAAEYGASARAYRREMLSAGAALTKFVSVLDDVLRGVQSQPSAEYSTTAGPA